MILSLWIESVRHALFRLSNRDAQFRGEVLLPSALAAMIDYFSIALLGNFGFHSENLVLKVHGNDNVLNTAS
jgi:hypothetical protein